VATSFVRNIFKYTEYLLNVSKNAFQCSYKAVVHVNKFDSKFNFIH